MIRTVIFDLDHTLCDYSTAKKNGMVKVEEVLQQNGILDVPAFWSDYEEREPGLYTQFLDKVITPAQYRIRRYADVLQGLHPSPVELSAELNRVFMQEANHNIQLFDDALPLITLLKEQGMTLVVLTNGPTDGQQDKMRALQLHDQMQKLYCSEEIGHAKPHPQAFHHVLQDLQIEAVQALMVGDSLDNDVRGAEQAGIRSILLDRNNWHGDYAGHKVSSLAEIADLIQHL